MILLEDDPDLRESIAEYLRMKQLDVIGAGSGKEFCARLCERKYDVAIVDVGLPDANGYELARVLATESDIGIIMMTGRVRVADRIHGYAQGADIYMTKPVDCAELELAVTNLARRVTGRKAADITREVTAPPPSWLLDRVRWQLVAPDGTTVTLSGREMTIMEHLAQTPGVVVSRSALAEALGYGDQPKEGRGLDAMVRRLRQKTLLGTGIALPVKNVHGVGLVFSGRIRFRGA